MSMSPEGALHAYVNAFVDELARAGVRHVCIAPGSRSTPLALTIAANPRLKTWMHLDERSAAFFALGIARMLGEPVVLLCTSGTAAANFLPAVVEAKRAGVPLLVLTADRPPELRDVGSAQTIDQNRLYGVHAKWFVEVAMAEATPDLLRYARTLAGRAYAMAASVPPGPVHLNFPFREPLVPVRGEIPSDLSAAEALAFNGRLDGAPWVSVGTSVVKPEPIIVERLADILQNAKRPIIVCGPQYDPCLAAPLASLASRLGAPLLADSLSQMRWGTHDRSAVIDRYDSALRHEATAATLAPDVVVRIGAPPTSKTLLMYLRRHGTARHIVVDSSDWPDPTMLASEVIHASPSRLASALLVELAGESHERSDEWLTKWRKVNETAGRALSEYSNSLSEPFEGRALAETAALIPDGGTLFVSSSMPVRDLDSFAPGDERRLRVLANRGANGIDGVTSTALGAAAVRGENDGPLVLVTGDIAFYHDMNGLLAARMHSLDATIVVINNDGGGIFSFLPQATETARFELLFGTPHGLTFDSAAELYGATYSCADTWELLRESVTRGIRGRGLHIVEMRTDRTRNVALHRGAWAAAGAALDSR